MATNYYEAWLETQRSVAERIKGGSPIMSLDKANWIKTPYDARSAAMIHPDNGFYTMGSTTFINEIPVGWNTGKHCHGEESIYILAGEGFSIVGERRYVWKAGDALEIYHGVVHQHFNSDSRPVRYLSAMATDVELEMKILSLEHYEDAARTTPEKLAIASDVPLGHFEWTGRTFSYDPLHVLNAEPNLQADQMKQVGLMKALREKYENGRVLIRKEEMPTAEDSQGGGTNWSLITRDAGFTHTMIHIDFIKELIPHSQSGRHAHGEALVYMLEGKGYSIIESEKYDWKAGDWIHVKGPYTDHQHFNPYDETVRYLRVGSLPRHVYPNYDCKEQFSNAEPLTSNGL